MKRTVWALIASSMLLSSIAHAGEVSAQEGFMSAGNAHISQGSQNLRGENALDWLKRTEIGLQFQTDYKPVYSVETVQPIGVQTEQTTHFTQFRLANDLTAGTIMNIGFGYRILSMDKSGMFGVNAFYDHGFRYGHARVSGGLEYFQGRNEYRVNVYHGISGGNEVGAVDDFFYGFIFKKFEKALSGYDYSMGTSFANAPWAKLYVKGYHWDYEHSDDANGYKVYSQLQVTPRLNMEIGYWDDNKRHGEKYVKVMYSLGNKGPAMFERGKPVFRNEDQKVTVESKRLDKVQRENDIRVEEYQGEDLPPWL